MEYLSLPLLYLTTVATMSFISYGLMSSSIESYRDNAGGAFISISHGFRFESIIISNPNSSKLEGVLGMVVMKFNRDKVMTDLISFHIASKFTLIVAK